MTTTRPTTSHHDDDALDHLDNPGHDAFAGLIPGCLRPRPTPGAVHVCEPTLGHTHPQ